MDENNDDFYEIMFNAQGLAEEVFKRQIKEQQAAVDKVNNDLQARRAVLAQAVGEKAAKQIKPEMM